jgi:hypothetical protein
MAGKTSSRTAKAATRNVAKKVAAKKAAVKKTAPRNAAAKKTATKKTSPRKAVAKKAAAGKPAPKKSAAKTAKPRANTAKPSTRSAGPALLSGGNPQIPKGYGDAPVQAYIAAIPGWKKTVARRLDALVERTVPRVYKAVKWNTPLYGIEGEGWFLAMHCFTNYVKVTFFRGRSLTPVPPVASKTPETRYLHIHEGDALDEAQLAAWIRQARALPGERM